MSEGLKSVDSPDTLDSLLDFLKQTASPVSGVMELRGLLLAQKEEKIELRSLVDQMKVDIQGIRYSIYDAFSVTSFTLKPNNTKGSCINDVTQFLTILTLSLIVTHFITKALVLSSQNHLTPPH